MLEFCQDCGGDEDEAEARLDRPVGGVAPVTGAVALFPVDAVLEDAPVAHSGDSGVRDGGATADHLPPATVPNEAPRALLHDLDAEGARSVGLVRVALHWDISLWLERPVDTAVVLIPILKRCTKTIF